MKKLYAGYLRATNRDGETFRTYAVIAHSQQEALGLGIQYAREDYPCSAGFWNQGCDFVEIPQHMIDKCSTLGQMN